MSYTIPYPVRLSNVCHEKGNGSNGFSSWQVWFHFSSSSGFIRWSPLLVSTSQGVLSTNNWLSYTCSIITFWYTKYLFLDLRGAFTHMSVYFPSYWWLYLLWHHLWVPWPVLIGCYYDVMRAKHLLHISCKPHSFCQCLKFSRSQFISAFGVGEGWAE